MIIAEGFGSELILLLAMVIAVGVIVVGWSAVMEFSAREAIESAERF